MDEDASLFRPISPRFVVSNERGTRMDLQLLLAASGMLMLMVLVPGPDWAYILGAGLRDRTIVPALGGILVGYVAVVADGSGEHVIGRIVRA